MIHEYAVDPEAVVTCSSPVRFLDDFGRDTGRLLAPLPKANRWVSEASRALSEGVQSGRIPGRLRSVKRLEERLANLQLSKPAKDALFSPVRRPYDGSLTWMQNAQAQHAQRPFHAVISDEFGADFTPDDADSLQPLFKAARGVKVARTAAAIQGALAPALTLSTRVVFVDPHFDPEKRRFRSVLKAALRALAPATAVSIVTSAELPVTAWSYKISRHLEALIPPGMIVSVVLLSEVSGGPKLHARYVLTDAGGIGVETGLDEGETGQETDIHLLAPEQYATAWAEYAELKGFEVTARFEAKGAERSSPRL